MAGFNLADLFERTVDVVPDRVALVLPDGEVTFAELEARANRLAHHLAAQGVGPDDHVAIDAYNGREWIETLLACLKLRAAVVNVNYRYTAEELAALLADADAVALVFHRAVSPMVAVAQRSLPKLRHVIEVDDEVTVSFPTGAINYEAALHDQSAVRDFPERSGDDRYLLYTGGTTGRPKGVLWRHEDLFFAALRGSAAPWGMPTDPGDLAAHAPGTEPRRWLLPAPMHHAGGQFGTLGALIAGNTLVVWTGRHFDPDALWDLVERHHVTSVGIVGDAMARPMAESFAARPVDITSLLSFGSGGAVLSPAVRRELRDLLPGVLLIDSLGSSESGVDSVRAIEDVDLDGGPPRFVLGEHEQVVDEHFRTVVPGSGAVGRIARNGHVPLAYYGDPERSAATFPVIDGVRWSVPGDHAYVEADGTVRLLGRGSLSINTGGEKVYVEEVEGVLKAFPAIEDAVVVGVPDPRWGEAVATVVQLRDGMELDEPALDAHCRAHLAGYKLPRHLVIADRVLRHATGKPDYAWARERAMR